MKAAAILATFEGQGFRLRAEGGRLLATPFASLNDAQRAELRAHKAELLRLLAPQMPVFEYRIYERLWLGIGGERCPLCKGDLYCWPAPPQNDEIGYACRNEPRAHRWTAQLSMLFPEIGSNIDGQ